MERFHIVRYTRDGKFDAVMAGCGRNRSTWDTGHSKSAAYKHAATLRVEQPEYRFQVEPTV